MEKINVPITFKEFEKRARSDLTNLIEEKVLKKINKISPTVHFFTSKTYTIYKVITIFVTIILYMAAISMAYAYRDWITSSVLFAAGITGVFISGVMTLVKRDLVSKIKKIFSSELNKLDFSELYKSLFNKFDEINCHSYEKMLMPSLVNAMDNSIFGRWPASISEVKKTTPKYNLECFQTPVSFQSQIWEKILEHEVAKTKVGLIEIELQNLEGFEDLEFIFGYPLWGLIFQNNLKNFNQVVIENAKFNLEFGLYSNDQMKTRFLFTPYSLQLILNFYTQYIKQDSATLHKWLIHKQFKKILIYFERNYSFFLDKKIDPSKVNPKDITNNIVNNIINDCYEVYAVLSMALMTSLIYGNPKSSF